MGSSSVSMYPVRAAVRGASAEAEAEGDSAAPWSALRSQPGARSTHTPSSAGASEIPERSIVGITRPDSRSRFLLLSKRRARQGLLAAALGLVSAPSLSACSAGEPPALPGAPALDAPLAARLEQALAAKGPGYQARTRHRREDGSPRFTNRLILEPSPYLAQHAHNPVNWYPWGDEAFEAARALGRPVLLSIGYSTCHWCHVMEEESFEDEEIAAYLNAHYVAIKVDREERPDVDAIYMSAVQQLSGRGGWPMTVWLTPDRRPFFGGTYFPARDGDRGVETGFLTLLRWLEQQYREKPQQVAETAAELVRRLTPKPLDDAAARGVPALDVTDSLVELYARNFDAEHGGLGQAPKFPSSLPLRLLLRQHLRSGRPDVLRMVTLTLEKMAAGGIRDHVGGGFHRYSTDRRWLVPHFEKMLYDNALLAGVYLEGYQATGNAALAEVGRSILRYLEREMSAPDGGFYSATDADSADAQGRRHEGWFFTWTPAEIASALGPAAAEPFQAFYGVTPGGNLEGRSILHEALTLEEAARRSERSPDALRAELAASRDRLHAVRGERPRPALDDKILTSWNGLAISAFARAAFVLDEPRLLEPARRAARRVLAARRLDGRLRHSVAARAGRDEAFLEDYAFLAAGLLDLFEASGERAWLERAIELQALLDRHYRDPARGGYFMTSDDHEALLVRDKPFADGAEPSGNAIAAQNLLRLHLLTAREAYRAAAEALLRELGPHLRESPESLVALELYHGDAREIVIVAPREAREARPLLDVLRGRLLPHAVRVVAVDGDGVRETAAIVPPLAGKLARDGRATAYVCRRGACELPTSDPAVLAEQLTRDGGP